MKSKNFIIKVLDRIIIGLLLSIVFMAMIIVNKSTNRVDEVASSEVGVKNNW